MSDDITIETHPVENHHRRDAKNPCPTVVTLRAYEVYRALHGEQRALAS